MDHDQSYVDVTVDCEFCADTIAWLNDVGQVTNFCPYLCESRKIVTPGQTWFSGECSAVLRRLIEIANRETSERKRMIFTSVIFPLFHHRFKVACVVIGYFTVIRCHHCSQHAPRGGNKRQFLLQLPRYQLMVCQMPTSFPCHHYLTEENDVKVA